MKFPRINFMLVLSLSAVLALIGVASVAYARSLTSLIPSREITVTSTPVATPTWTVASKIAEAKQLLADAQPGVFGDPITYNEQRVSTSGGILSTHLKQLKEPEKEIALAILNTDSGEIQTLMIRKRGADLITPAGWQINILERPSGIRWNGWNTAYQISGAPGVPVTRSGQFVVIGNVYPDETDKQVLQKTKTGKKVYTTQRTVTYRYYVPYSPDLSSEGLAQTGAAYLQSIVTEAFKELKSQNVMSQALPGQLVADVFGAHQDFFQHIPLLEQTDLTEFELDPDNTIARAQVIIGANGAGAFNATCNSVAACGWLQFTPGTYKMVANGYPAAKLITDFKSGAADHVNSMKAAILLYDSNLKGVIKAGGDQVVSDPKLEEYLASAYNGAPTHVYKTLAAAIVGGIQDWISALSVKKGGLKAETQGYLVKLRYIQQHPSSLAVQTAS